MGLVQPCTTMYSVAAMARSLHGTGDQVTLIKLIKQSREEYSECRLGFILVNNGNHLLVFQEKSQTTIPSISTQRTVDIIGSISFDSGMLLVNNSHNQGPVNIPRGKRKNRMNTIPAITLGKKLVTGKR